MREVPTQKKASNGKHFVEYVVFDKCLTSSLPNTLPINEPSNLEHHVATFRFARRKGDSISIPVLRQYCPEDMQGFHREIGSPSVARSPSGGAGDGIAQQISQLAKAIDTLTLAQTKSFAEQQAMSARVRALERSPSPTAAEHSSVGGTGAGPRRVPGRGRAGRVFSGRCSPTSSPTRTTGQSCAIGGPEAILHPEHRGRSVALQPAPGRRLPGTRWVRRSTGTSRPCVLRWRRVWPQWRGRSRGRTISTSASSSR